MKDSLIYFTLPISLALAFISTYYVSREAYDFWFHSHTSILEMVIGALLLFTFLSTLFLLGTKVAWQNKQVRWWLILYSIGVFYFLGEDQNWGQYYFDLKPSEFFIENNKEKEINLHNISSWFNQKPRLLVEIWVIIVGILVPLGWKFPVNATKGFVPEYFWMSKKIVPLALAIMLTKFPSTIVDLGIVDSFSLEVIRLSEIQELLIAWFMFLFIYELKSKL